MRVRTISLLHLAIPFKGVFRHGRKGRSCGDTVLVKLVTDAGVTGWGEVLARSYVTGETTDDIMTRRGEILAASVIGQRFDDQIMLTRWLSEGLNRWRRDLALFGGIELALWQCLEREHSLDMETLVGPQRARPVGRCVTIGFDVPLDSLRIRAIDARLKRATAVKLKVGLGPEIDAERLHVLSAHFEHRMPLRIDGNGTFELEDAIALLDRCRHLPVESFEQPFPSSVDDLERRLRALYEHSGVAMMADESVCSVEQAEQWANSGAYQLYNIRVGKHGGLLGSRLVRDCALANGVGLVGGSMVGESGLLTQASALLLSRSDALPYIEGLGQNRSWLSVDPVERFAGTVEGLGEFRFRENRCEPLLQSSRHYR